MFFVIIRNANNRGLYNFNIKNIHFNKISKQKYVRYMKFILFYLE